MKTKTILPALVSKICVALLSILGYSCKEDNDLCMYGTPTGTWEIKGTVTENETSAATAATIKVTQPNMDSSFRPLAETHTDNNGNYITTKTELPFKELKVVCVPDDPELEADSSVVKLTYQDIDEKDPWGWGKAETTVNFRLTKKDN